MPRITVTRYAAIGSRFTGTLPARNQILCFLHRRMKRMGVDDKPLEGRHVVVTRAAEQAKELTSRLRALGAEVLTIPLVEFAPPDDTSALDAALAEIESFDWLLLTSQNAVRFVADRAQSLDVDLAKVLDPAKTRPKVAAVGRMTEQAARSRRWRIDRVASGRGGLEMASGLGAAIRGKCVLLPRSDRATPDLPRALTELGAEAVPVVAYRTLASGKLDPAMVALIARAEVDVLTFASPSAFHALEERLKEETFRRLITTARLAAIGPTTAAAIRRAGAEVAIESSVPTAAGLAAAIAAYYAAHPITPGR